jgi:branched-chain amino acid transport system substrate-binding protein
MNKPTKIIIGIIVAIIIIYGALYILSKKPVPTLKKEPIKIGFIAPLTGDGASYGQTELNSINMAVNEINQKGGIKGRLLQIIAEDGKCDGKEATIAANKLINIDKVKIILGGSCSSETLAIAPLTEQNKVLVLTGIASNPKISDVGEYIFRLTPTDEDFFRPQARAFYNELGYKKVAVLSEQTDYCITAREAFIDEFKKLGGEVVAVEVSSPKEKDYRTYITKIKAKNPEAVVIIPQTPITGGLMAKQVKELMPNVQILGSYSMESSDAIKASEGALNGAIIFSIATDIPSGKTIIEKYKQTYNKEPVDYFLPLEGWDRVFLVKQAIEYCKDINTDCMKDYLYNNKFNLSLGEYRFNSKGDITIFYANLFKVENNKANPMGPTRTVVKE